MKNGIIALLWVLLVPVALAASCGAATCPLVVYETHPVGHLSFGMAYETIDQDRVYVGSRGAALGAISGHHDELRTLNQRWILRSAYALTPEVQVRAELPIVTRDHTHIHHHHGAVLVENWNFSGIGDAGIFVDYTFASDHTGHEDAAYGSTLMLSVGGTLPTGRTDIHNSDGDEAEASIQPGSGGYSGTTSVYYRKPLLAVSTLAGRTGVFALTTALSYTSFGAGTNGWKFGDSILASLGGEYPLWEGSVFFVQLDSKWQDAASPGTTSEPVSNTGGYWLYLSPGMRITLWEGLIVNGIVQVPIHQHVNGIQIVSGRNVQIGLTGTF